MSTDGQGTKWCRNVTENFSQLRWAHKRYRQTDDRQTDFQLHVANVNVYSRSLIIIAVRGTSKVKCGFFFKVPSLPSSPLQSVICSSTVCLLGCLPGSPIIVLIIVKVMFGMLVYFGASLLQYSTLIWCFLVTVLLC